MPDDKMAYFFYLQIILPVYVFIYQFAFSITSYWPKSSGLLDV